MNKLVILSIFFVLFLPLALATTVVTLDTPDDDWVTQLDEFNFSFTATSPSLSNFACNLTVGGQVTTLSSVNNNTPTIFSSVSLPSDTASQWNVSCGGGNPSPNRTIIQDSHSMDIVLENPVDEFIELYDPVVDFRFMINDTYTSTPDFSCDLLIGGVINQSLSSLPNGTSLFFPVTFASDDTYDWLVSCEDPFGNKYNSSTRTLDVAITPQLLDLLEITSPRTNAVLTLTGLLNKLANITVTVQNQDTLFSTTHSGTTFYYPDRVVPRAVTNISVISSGNPLSLFDVADPGLISTGDRLLFEGHNKSDYLFYEVILVPGSQTIRISPDAEEPLSVGEQVFIFDETRPEGWFEMPVTLTEGNNSILISPNASGFTGSESLFYVQLDSQPPTLTTMLGNAFPGQSTYFFNISDATGVNFSSFYVNATDGVSTTTFATSSYTGSLPITGPAITCSGSLTLQECQLTLNLSDEAYDLDFYVEDTLGNADVLSGPNILIKSTVQPVPLIFSETGSITNDATFNVSWTSSPDPLLDYYQLSVGTLPGLSDVVDWFNVSSSLSNNYHIVDPAIEYGEIYFVSIRPVDTLGLVGPSNSTELIYTQDPTPPLFHEAFIETVSGSWVNSLSQLQLRWNFTDPETGIDRFEYAIGTQPKSNGVDWDNILGVTTSTSLTGELVTELSLTQNETYYFSVRAKNNNSLTVMWSPWESSLPVRVDVEPPQNVSLNYAQGNITSLSVDIEYNTGFDLYSTISHARLQYRTSALQGGVCQPYGGWSTLVSSLPLTNNAVLTHSYTGIQTATCYQFRLLVEDFAGNQEIVQKDASYRFAVDTTPPSGVNIQNPGPAVFTTRDLTFTWDHAVDPESGIQGYECSLGTSPGSSSVRSWGQCGPTSQHTYANLNLVHGEVYYFNVRAINGHGLVGPVNSSLGHLYLDVIPPAPLSVIQVDQDTQGTPVWFAENTTSPNATILLTGEEDLSCVWSFFDIPYTPAPSASYAHACDEISPGVYSCEIADLTQGEHTVSVACRDQNNNAQTAQTNTDITFLKEFGPPSIEFISPATNGTIIDPVPTLFEFDIYDVSPFSTSYELTDGFSLLQSGTFQDNELLLDLSVFQGELFLDITANDSLGNVDTKTLSFIVNDGSPLFQLTAHGSFVPDPFYFNDDMLLTVTSYFSNETVIRLEDDQQQVLFSNSSSFPTLQTLSELNLSIDSSQLTDGNYTLVVFTQNGTSSFERNYTFVFDTFTPLFDFTAEDELYDVPLTENTPSVRFRMVVDYNSPVSVYLNYTIGSHQELLPAHQIHPRDWRPEEKRFEVELTNQHFEAMRTIEYQWIAVDAAGNVNATSFRTLDITNTEPLIPEQTLPPGLEGNTYQAVFQFEDEDFSQTNFSCTSSLLSMDVSHIPGTRSCLITWSLPMPGTNTFEFTVTDKDFDNQPLTTVSRDLIIEVSPQQVLTFDLDVDVFSFATSFESEAVFKPSSFTMGTGSFAQSLPNTPTYNLTFAKQDFMLQAINSSESPILFYRKNFTKISYPDGNLDKDNQFVPLTGRAVTLSFPTTPADEYFISFNYTAFGLTPEEAQDLRIFHFYFDHASEQIIYDHPLSRGQVSTFIQGDLIVTNTTSFSAFVLALQVPTCFDGIQNQGEEGVDCGGPCDAECPSSEPPSGGGSSGGSGGGIISGGYVPPTTPLVSNESTEQEVVEEPEEEVVEEIPAGEATCFDGIQNCHTMPDGSVLCEEGVDCGGPCGPCAVEATCFDGIQNCHTMPDGSVLCEEGVDCGGPCDAVCEQEVEPEVQAPLSSDLIPWNIVYVSLGVLLVGSLLGMYISSSRKEEAQGFGFDERYVSLAEYINKQTEDPDLVKSHLIEYGYSKQDLDNMFSAFTKEDQILSIISYFEEYSKQGYSLEEMSSWLVEQDVDTYIIAIAVAAYKDQQSF